MCHFGLAASIHPNHRFDDDDDEDDDDEASLACDILSEHTA